MSFQSRLNVYQCSRNLCIDRKLLKSINIFVRHVSCFNFHRSIIFLPNIYFQEAIKIGPISEFYYKFTIYFSRTLQYPKPKLNNRLNFKSPHFYLNFWEDLPVLFYMHSHLHKEFAVHSK